MFPGGKQSLQKYSEMRSYLCNLYDDGELDILKTKYKEINSFVKIKKLMGNDCDYLLSICQVISANELLLHELPNPQGVHKR
jgi:hypothetical protein|tara:strand:- start:168 stop:413 length:246 start_codon:yes stop_codon:yes gene_type:complete